MVGEVDKVRRKYSRSGKDIRFTTAWLDDEETQRAVSAAGQQNRFYPQAVARVIRRIAEKDSNARFSFGRSGSPLLFIETRKPQLSIGVISSMDRLREPDELSKVVDPGHLVVEPPKKRSGHSIVRAWWD